jgi:hypothetical protein
MSRSPSFLQQIADRTFAELDPSLEQAMSATVAAEDIDPRILASLDHSPHRLELYLTFYEQLVTGPLGSDRLKHVIRRRVAQLTELRERGDLGQGAEPEPPAALAADELALTRFMDSWAIDHTNVDPAIHDELREHFSDAELTELFWAVAIVFASARVGAAFGITTFPERGGASLGR